MFGIIRDAVRAVWSAITRAKNLAAENVALRHQLDVVLRPTRSRPRLKLKLRDRVLLVWLSRVWSGWKDCVRIVQPATVIAWHRRGPPSPSASAREPGTLLDLEEQAPQARAAAGSAGRPRVDPDHLVQERALGRPACAR